MPYPVRYSTRASTEYEEILEYVIKHFGFDVAAKADAHFEEIIDHNSINPYLYPLSENKKDLRRCVLSPQTILYYRFSGEGIELVSFRGTRMNPETLGL